MHSEKIEELAKALAQAQGEIVGAKKDTASRPFKDSRVVLNYADLASVWCAIREPFAKNGLSVIQGTEQTQVEGKILVVSTLFHVSGQWHRSELLINAPTDMKILGASLSYARRYLLSAQAGVYQVDLDSLTDISTDNDGHNEIKTPQTIKTDKEKKALSKEIPPISHDKFVTPEQATAYRKECVRLKIPTKIMKAELKKHGITMPDNIPADQFENRFQELNFLANENKNGVAA